LRTRRQASNGESNLVQMDEEMDADDVQQRCFFACADRQLEAVPTRLDLDKLLAKLNPLQRQLLEMAYLEGMSEQEIADLLGSTTAKVKSKLHHARRQALKINSQR
jgi:RNA polymerase sigma factor (sigma-70 family)